VARFTVTGTLFDVVHDTAGVLSQGLAVVLGSTLGLIQGNVFALSNVATDTRGIFLQPDVLNTDQLTITHNRFENVATGIVAVDLSNALIEGNVYAGTGTPLTLVGTVGTQVIVRGNHPQTSRLTLATNASAPLVAGAPDGLVVANNSASTTITQFQGGYEGMQLEVYTANGNTTLQHSVNLLLAGSANVTLSAGSLLTLRRTLGAWREVSRTVL
jgi:hypothetical protein